MYPEREKGGFGERHEGKRKEAPREMSPEKEDAHQRHSTGTKARGQEIGDSCVASR